MWVMARTILLSVVLVGVLGACGSQQAAAPSESIAGTNRLSDGLPPNVDWNVPADDLDDWTTYADQVAVVKVLSEATPKPTPEPDDGGDYDRFWSRSVRLQIERTLWHRPGARVLEGEVELPRDGMLRYPPNQPDKLYRAIPAGTVWIVPGHTYVVPLTYHSDKGRWSRLNDLALPVVDGVIDATLGADEDFAPSSIAESRAVPVVRALHGRSLDEAEALFEQAQPGQARRSS